MKLLTDETLGNNSPQVKNDTNRQTNIGLILVIYNAGSPFPLFGDFKEMILLH